MSMTLHEIRRAVDAGRIVHWCNTAYRVHRDSLGQYFITYQPTGNAIGLTDCTGKRLNGTPAQFFLALGERPPGPPAPPEAVTWHCSGCGSTDVQRSAWALWNPELQCWEVAETGDHAFCNGCEGETTLAERTVLPDHPMENPPETAILNGETP